MKRISLLLLVLCTSLSWAQEQKLTADTVIEKSLAAVGAPADRARFRFYEWTGTADLRATNGASATGTTLLLSEGEQMKFQTKFKAGLYAGDQFVFDGKKVLISQDNHGKRSSLGEFLFQQAAILENGILGGVMTTRWPLYDVKSHPAKMKYVGLKKVDGVSCHVVRYEPKKVDPHLTISMFFDADTFRHLKTAYEITVPTAMTAQKNSIERNDDTYLIEETFSDFRQLGAVTLPLHYKISYTTTAADVGNWQFDMKYDQLNGIAIPPGQ